MKDRFITIVLITGLNLLFFGCKDKTNLTILNVSLESLHADSLSYYTSRDGIGAYPVWGWNKIALDKNFKAEIHYITPVLNMILIQPASAGYGRTLSLYLLPEEDYDITLSTLADRPLTIKGPDAEAQYFLNNFDYRFVRKYQTGHGDLDEIYSDTIPESILDHLEMRMQPDLLQLENLNKKKQINPVRFEALKDHVIYTYLKELLNILQLRSKQESQITLSNYEHIISYPIDAHDPGIKNMLSELFTTYPYNHKNFILNPDYHSLLNNWLWFKSLDDSLPMSTMNDELVLAKKYLSPSLYEFYFATKFGKVSLQEPFSAVEKRYQQFKEEFPDSKYLPGIEKLLPRLNQIYSRYSIPDQVPDTLQ